METEGDASNVVFLEGNAADEDKLCTQKPLFRLMKFVRETQCEMEVVKPVLDELEVMRLCREFGMMSSVNPKDFDFDILHARDFDDDFVRFLRYELLENSSSESVKFKGLFGKQDQIQAALTEMNVCSTRTTKSLDVNDEGIYCVKFDPECASEDKLSGLVVFSWIRDELFEPQSLRDIPTFVLRFLTGLVPDIVCCTSGSDLEQLKAAMLASESYEDEFPSYSVSFEVKKQVDQEDDVKCAAVDSIDLGEPTQGYSDVSLLKGSYPALASKGTMSPQVRRETQNPRFNSHAKFAVWLKDQSHQYRITLSGTIARSRKLCEALLRQFALWPEELLKSCREEQDKTRREEFDLGTRELVAEVERQRKQARELSSVLFELQADAVQEPPPNPSIEASSKAYGEFLDWINSKHTKKVDHKIKLQLDAPTNLREIQATLLELYTNGLKGEANKLLDMCATLTKPELVKNVKKFRERSHGKKIDSSDDKPGAATDKCQSRSWEAFLMEVAEPLNSLRKRWWIAVEHVLAEAKDMQLKLLKKKADKSNLDDSERQIIDDAFKVLCESLLSKEGLMLTLNATTRNRGAVFCDSVHEVMAPPTTFLDISKVEMNDNKPKKMEPMGRLLFNPTESHVAMYTVKVRSAIQIVAGKERMCAKLLHFPHVNGGRRPLPTNEKVIRTFGKFADICDYNVRDRVMAFVSKEMVGIYKLDEAFKHMELIKSIDLGVRSTLTALPFQDIMLIDSTVYVTDSTGYTQSIGIHNDQTSNVVRICSSNEGHGYTSSGKMSLADNLVVGAVNVHANDSGAFEGALECISRDDYRGLPILPLGMTFLVDQPQCVCIDDQIFVLDPLARKMYVFAIQVTVRSDSYRMQQCDDSEGSKTSESESGITNCLRKQHWMYTFYHVFEKFPVQGLLESGPARHVKVNVICSSNSDANAVLENCHDFLSLLMSDLLALNKPLNGLNLTEGLAVARTLDGISLQTKSLISLLQTLITFLPIQICRAEGNALTVLRDGMDDTLNEMDLDMQTWEAIDIAESIRFGLLSPLLSAWRGRCVVITSMGKQSTGKSYFLNHLTGSSFAIAGNRCTDGAWMTLRMMKDILFVVLDFEGLGSFERTDQEDVFLSVLNASLSMFTIFRMEMRFDKVVDGMFSNFQKGTNLLKSDEHLFQGSLYMSVKDVNTNDNHAVLSEFKKKLELLMANREQNFLTTMYSGKVAINSSPPLGTNGYYASLRHTRQLITKMIQDDPLSGFATGNSFHDCVRLVLAKISILDWTSVDETSQRLQMNDIYRKLPGALRTGCLIPVDAQTKSGTVQQYLMEPLLQNENDLATLRLDQLSRDYSEFLESWMTVNKMVLLDEWEDDSIDFGPLCFDEDSLNTEAVHLTLVNLFQRFLALISKGPLDKLTEEDYANFDAVLSFLICRRETKVALWVKQLLGAERFMKEWEQIEDYFCTFKAMLSRCEQGLCEYCIQNYSSGKQTPPCVIKAGHEGKCNCDGVFQWGDHKYAVGDKGIAEMCNMYCSSAGRGHAHYMKCNKEIAATCLYTGFEDQRRHCKSKLKSSLDYEIDEVLHKKYWETIGWEDPCQSAAERALFAKCPYMCNAPEHKGKDKSPSCCDLQAWHPPATPPPVLEQNVSYIDGHRFHCSHANATGMHHVFVLDCSGSMRGNPWRMLLKGVREYLQTRLSSGSTQDVVSMVTFGDKGKTEYERVRIQSAPSRYVHFGGGGTYYANGLKEANAIISRSKSMLYKPVLIFFTDGRPADRKKGLKLATDIKHRYALFGLQTFVVGMDE
ncbi:Vacuolar protein sorting-associated protein 13A [Phytophthora boehmeriae]|uniref:Vacuolar protein sorting-associated protein 13A n=1 Tax=Phytophthora boehmeriae TaxID=109152 RepID=A0A8T1WYI2_9STRA|nr:Vacuolar protein sorting-associated protein 13A [Phytophthora boehmeriae]